MQHDTDNDANREMLLRLQWRQYEYDVAMQCVRRYPERNFTEIVDEAKASLLSAFAEVPQDFQCIGY